MTAVEAMEAVAKVQQSVPDTDVRITRRIEIGHCIQQGHVYTHRVDEAHPRGALIGTGTCRIDLGGGRMSPHTVEGDVDVYEGIALPSWVRLPDGVEAKDILGPVIVARGEFREIHNEHQHHIVKQAGTYQVTDQIDIRTMRRVKD